MLPATQSGGHKVKLTSVALAAGNRSADASMRGVLAGAFHALTRTEAAHELHTQAERAYAHAAVVRSE